MVASIEVYTSWGHLRLQDSRLELEKLAAVLLDTGQTSRCYNHSWSGTQASRSRKQDSTPETKQGQAQPARMPPCLGQEHCPLEAILSLWADTGQA